MQHDISSDLVCCSDEPHACIFLQMLAPSHRAQVLFSIMQDAVLQQRQYKALYSLWLQLINIILYYEYRYKTSYPTGGVPNVLRHLHQGYTRTSCVSTSYLVKCKVPITLCL